MSSGTGESLLHCTTGDGDLDSGDRGGGVLRDGDGDGDGESDGDGDGESRLDDNDGDTGKGGVRQLTSRIASGLGSAPASSFANTVGFRDR